MYCQDEKEVIIIARKPDETKIMRQAIEKARETMNEDLGGPFGAAVVDAEGNILAVASNTVLGDNDPTAHAEVNAIRAAAKKKGSYDLSGCTLYTTAHPCPMCLGAIIWANIKHIRYGCRPEDADSIGFRDDFIYDFIKGDMKDKEILTIDEGERDACLRLFKEYKDKGKVIY